MNGIVITYDYSGDEATWQQAVDAFIANIDGGGRIHIGHWDEPETLAHLQQQDFFKTFAGQVKDFAGDSLQANRFERRAETAPAD